ncbi:MAG TPA: type II toxin-antitoxin system RelE/ParE family toxin [Mycobacterium sp.]|uniref:type II toxin-antitoxin system RelE/ParE family toxin n=1 Tax=Mycobacterium sp. TaxID=1785 RepID=UPI002F415BEF
MSPSVVFTPEAEDQLAELYRYIAAAGSAEVAARYTEAIVAYCEELAAFPHRGSARDNIRSRLRTIGFRRRSLLHSLRWTRPWRSSVSSTAGAITRRF